MERLDAERSDLSGHECVTIFPDWTLNMMEHTRVQRHGPDIDQKIETRSASGRFGEASHFCGGFGNYGDPHLFSGFLRFACPDNVRIVEEALCSLHGDRTVDPGEL